MRTVVTEVSAIFSNLEENLRVEMYDFIPNFSFFFFQIKTVLKVHRSQIEIGSSKVKLNSEIKSC